MPDRAAPSRGARVISRRGLAIAIILAAIVGLGLRLPGLGEKPMHNDEGVNAIKFGALWQEGFYRYDLHEYHGPTLPYATWLLQKVTGGPDFAHMTEVRLRAVTVAFGVVLILLIPLVSDGLGRAAAAWAAWFTALSPAMVYYSRDYIHELLLVAFTFLALAAGWRWWCSGRIGWALLAGAALGLMHATKETFVIALCAALVGLTVCTLWNRWIDARRDRVTEIRHKPIHLAAGLGVWMFLAVILFSSFFTYANGPLDSIRTYATYFGRAGGETSHTHPWSFYLQRLLYFQAPGGRLWTEAPLFVLAGIGGALGFARRGMGGANGSFLRFLAVYSLALMFAYSVLSYKTPWCLLGWWHGMILLAGVGAAACVRTLNQPSAKAAAVAALLAISAFLGFRAWQAAIPLASDRRNPFVYAQTSPDLLNLVTKVENLASVAPQGHSLTIKVIGQYGDYWPLPWYLRRFNYVTLGSNLSVDPYADIMIVSADFKAGLDEKKAHVMNGYFELRPGVLLELYVDLGLWQRWLAKHPAPTSE